MSVLSKPDLKRYLKKRPPIVEGLLDEELQVGTNGIDLSVSRVEKFCGAGLIGFERKHVRTAKTTPLTFDSRLHLRTGCYKIIYNEIVNMPLNIVAIARPRSTLLRNGATVETALWDSGYIGRSESLLIVHNLHGLDLLKNARVVQLVFMKASKRLRSGYKGKYMLENIPEIRRQKRTSGKQDV